TDQLRLSDDPFSVQRLRDLKAHIHEQRRQSGAAFQDVRNTENKAEFACGIVWAEDEGWKQHLRHDQLRSFISPPATSIKLTENAPIHQKGRRVTVPHGLDSQIAAFTGFKFEEVTNTIMRRRRFVPLRERRKAGRKPIGPIAMTSAERVRKHRLA